MKNAIKGLINKAVDLLDRSSGGQYVSGLIAENAMKKKQRVSYKNFEFEFAVPNALNKFRADSFATKEPETLEWIDAFPSGCVLWDIGANVGLYSIYAAKTRGCSVFAFEPSVFNLEILARNIVLNDQSSHVTIVPLPLNDQLGHSNMRMTTTEWGGALSSFDRNLGFDGQKLEQVFEYKISGVSMEDAKNKLGIPQPDYIKMDVDGIEHYILMGGAEVLKDIKGILIEVNDDFDELALQCKNLLTEAGLVLKEKKHGEVFEDATSLYNNCYNQIWARVD